MSATVDQHIVQAFRDGITQRQQQGMSRLRGAVDIDPNVVGDRAYYNQLGQTQASKRTTRHGDTEYTDTPHLRRMVTLESWDLADLLDKDDKVQMLTDPTNSYSESFAMAMARTTDDIIIEAATATAATGQTGTGTESFPSDREVAVVGTSDLQIEQVMEAKEKLDEKEVDSGERYFVCSAKQITSLLGQVEVASADYNTVRALVTGDVDSYLGFTFIRSERLASAGDVIRECLAFQRNSIKLAIGINPAGSVDVLPTKKYSTQVYYEMRIGATRMDPNGVVRIKCDEVA